MLCGREIMYKQWVPIGDTCELRERSCAVRTGADYCELLKYAYKAMTSDLAALLQLKGDETPADRWLGRYVEKHKRAPGLIANLADWEERVLLWNGELLRIADGAGAVSTM